MSKHGEGNGYMNTKTCKEKKSKKKKKEQPKFSIPREKEHI